MPFATLPNLTSTKNFPFIFRMCLFLKRNVVLKRPEVYCEGESIPVPVQALAYVESKGHEQCLHMTGGQEKELYTRLTMKQLEALSGKGSCESINNILSISSGFYRIRTAASVFHKINIQKRTYNQKLSILNLHHAPPEAIFPMQYGPLSFQHAHKKSGTMWDR